MKITTLIEEIRPGSSMHFSVWPTDAIHIDNVKLTNEDSDLDIVCVTVNSLILAAFSKKKEICSPGSRILVLVENTSVVPLSTGVIIEGPTEHDRTAIEVGSIVVNLRGRPLRIVGIVGDKARMRDDYTGEETSMLVSEITPGNGWAVRKRT